jgi:tRNA pseudouridine55 synthase
LYELARKGEVIDRPPRPVKILAINASPNGYIDVTCSKGTYIRSLCVDIGEMLGCGATMGELVRTRSGNFSLEDSISLAQFKEAAENGTLGEFILPPQKLLPYPAFTLQPEAVARAKNGNPVPRERTGGAADKCWLLAPDETLIGLYRFEKNAFRAEVMM